VELANLLLISLFFEILLWHFKSVVQFSADIVTEGNFHSRYYKWSWAFTTQCEMQDKD
jgi:hypothetical protein